jgi:hypothetical protein
MLSQGKEFSAHKGLVNMGASMRLAGLIVYMLGATIG